MKSTYYFSHDYNARTDPKIKKLVAKHGLCGYGIYWALVEDLYNNANRLPVDFETLAYDLRVEQGLLESVVMNFGLFQVEDSFFCSKSIDNRLENQKSKSEKARESALKRWERNATDMRSHSDGNAIKKRKEKNIKEKQIKVNNTGGDAAMCVEVSEDFKRFLEWIAINAPRVSKMKEPFTESQFFEIKKIAPSTQICTTLTQMHNWEPLIQKNRSAYLTCVNWIKKTTNGQQTSNNQQGRATGNKATNTIKGIAGTFDF